mgnify:CR=1|jgi:hypothetical protein
MKQSGFEICARLSVMILKVVAATIGGSNRGDQTFGIASKSES